jgi:DNA-binding XRE family transcriptional regulator
MAKKFNDLRQRMAPEDQSASKLLAHKLKEEMPLYELRQAHGLSQTTIANILEVRQPSIAKMEKSVDMYISTLRNYIEAMGGALHITAAFPDGEVQIGNFTGINRKARGKVIKVKARTSGRAISISAPTQVRKSSRATGKKLVIPR